VAEVTSAPKPFAGMPLPFLVFLMLTRVVAVLTGMRRWGFRAYAVGASETVARYSRLDIRRIQVTTYTIAGLLSSMAGLSTLATTNAASVSFGTSFLLLPSSWPCSPAWTPTAGRACCWASRWR
jgi:ribose/xylose/arabinose/galactoside ABC-type transport system permease subunit